MGVGPRVLQGRLETIPLRTYRLRTYMFAVGRTRKQRDRQAARPAFLEFGLRQLSGNLCAVSNSACPVSSVNSELLDSLAQARFEELRLLFKVDGAALAKRFHVSEFPSKRGQFRGACVPATQSNCLNRRSSRFSDGQSSFSFRPPA